MIIIPEIQTVFIRIPKTGSTSLTKAIREKYPRSFEPYRHMGAQGILLGYGVWRRIAVIREPLARMKSLYSFCSTVVQEPHCGAGWAAKQRASTAMPFIEWLTTNEVRFCSPEDAEGKYNPFYQGNSRLPENKTSQQYYLSGYEKLYPIEHIQDLAVDLGLPYAPHLRKSRPFGLTLAEEHKAALHIEKYMSWDRRTHQKLLERSRIG
jgi:hypothetical protein